MVNKRLIGTAITPPQYFAPLLICTRELVAVLEYMYSVYESVVYFVY